MCFFLISFHPAAKGVRQKEFGKKVTKKVTEASEKVTERVPKTKKSDRTPFAALLLRHPEVCEIAGCVFDSDCSGRLGLLGSQKLLQKLKFYRNLVSDCCPHFRQLRAGFIKAKGKSKKSIWIAQIAVVAQNGNTCQRGA